MLRRLTKREACPPRSLAIRLQDGRDVSALVYIYEGKNILEFNASVGREGEHGGRSQRQKRCVC